MKFTRIIKKIILSNGFTVFIRITLIIAIIIATYYRKWLVLFLTLISYALTYFYVIFKRYNINLPREFQVIIIFFIYGALFLGEANSFYVKFWWWDSLHHFFSGLALGFTGFLILYIFHKSGRFEAPASTMFLFTFCFALASLTIWEIFEFFLDEFLGVNWQKARYLCQANLPCDSRLGLLDTMYDLIIDSIGALITAFSGYIFIKKGKSFEWFTFLIKKFEELNKDLFKLR